MAVCGKLVQPCFDQFRGDPRYGRLKARIGLWEIAIGLLAVLPPGRRQKAKTANVSGGSAGVFRKAELSLTIPNFRGAASMAWECQPL